MPTTRIDLLQSLLAALVKEWGAPTVRQCLSAMEIAPRSGIQHSDSNVDSGARRKREKPNAASIAAKASLPNDRKLLVQELAHKFDLKEFLPSAGDIRHFLETNNEVAPTGKQRQDAFRSVLMTLSKMPADSLHQLVAEEIHRGPSRLGPLSEAMRLVGRQRNEGISLGTSAFQRAKLNEPTSPEYLNAGVKGRNLPSA